MQGLGIFFCILCCWIASYFFFRALKYEMESMNLFSMTGMCHSVAYWHLHHFCTWWDLYNHVIFQVWCDFQHGTASPGWFYRWFWEWTMVATPLKWLQYYNMDGGDKSGVNWVVGFMVNEICWQYCEGSSLCLRLVLCTFITRSLLTTWANWYLL